MAKVVKNKKQKKVKFGNLAIDIAQENWYNSLIDEANKRLAPFH